MNTRRYLSILALLLAATANPAFAMMSIEHVTKERAQKLGIDIRAKPSGPDAVWLELEFKPEGELKSFSHVSLEIREKDKLLVGYAAMREKRTASGSVVFTFMANRAFADKITLSVVTGVPTNRVGHELKVKNFVDLNQLR